MRQKWSGGRRPRLASFVLIVPGILSLLTKAKNPKAVGQLPKKSRDGATISQLGRPDGSQLRVECYGREDAPPIILTHGWGANSTEWDYLKKELSDAFRLIVWDLPGLGLSTRPPPTDRDYSLENLSHSLIEPGADYRRSVRCDLLSPCCSGPHH